MKPPPPLDPADTDYVFNTIAELCTELRGQRLIVRDPDHHLAPASHRQ
jgi:hypothetical protein